jgi:hypothetical protein
VEDTRRQRAVTRLLIALDEPDVRRGRDGYRPHMGALDAGDTRTITRPCGRDHWGVEADLQGFFDPSEHAGMLRMVAQRLEDRARLRLIKTWLNAGVLDTDGQVVPPVTGTPHGGIVSPIRVNVSRHDALDPAIPAHDLRALCDHGSGELSQRFDHPFPFFEATLAIRHDRVSC